MQTTAVPHAKLRLSQANVRTIARDTGLEALAASIAEHGLLQPLVVTPAKGRKALYDVHAGGRRWRAIGLLIERGLWPSDRLVDVCLPAIGEASPRGISLAENILREAMAPADEARAYSDVMGEGRRNLTPWRRHMCARCWTRHPKPICTLSATGSDAAASGRERPIDRRVVGKDYAVDDGIVPKVCLMDAQAPKPPSIVCRAPVIIAPCGPAR